MFKMNMKTGGSAFCDPYTGEEDEWYEATEEQTRLANLNYSFVSYKENTPEGYEARKPLYPGDIGAIEKKDAWLVKAGRAPGRAIV